MPPGFIPISLFWFFYMAGLGVIFPYQTLYFQEDVGLTGTQLGLTMAIYPLIGIIASPIWGQWADRSGQRRATLFILAVGSSVGYLLVSTASNFLYLLFCMALLSAFAAPAMSVSSSLSFAVLGKAGADRFGHVRVWGTIGYLMMVVLFPEILTWAEDNPEEESRLSLRSIFPVAATLCLFAGMFLLWVPPSQSLSIRAKRGDINRILSKKAYIKLLVLAFLAFGLLSGPIVLFPVFVVEKGGDIETISRLWIPMLMLEIPLIYFTGSGLRRIGARGLIALGISCDGLRWLVTALAPNLSWIFGIQLLHGVVVVGLIIGMQLYVEQEVPENLRATGQTLLGAIMGFGAVISHLWTGLVLEHIGTNVPYLAAGSMSIALGIYGWFFLEKKK